MRPKQARQKNARKGVFLNQEIFLANRNDYGVGVFFRSVEAFHVL
jgi:hypothetical protein